MNTPITSANDKEFLNRILETTIRIGVVAILVVWCYQIVRPFIIPVLWGIIIAVAVSPVYLKLQSALRGKTSLAATLITLVLFIVLLMPTIMLADTLVDGARMLADRMQAGTLEVPPPPASVASWPLIGEPLDRFWRTASENLGTALKPVAPQLKALGTWLLGGAAGVGLGILQFIAAIIISGVLMAYSDTGTRAARSLGNRLAGHRGTEYVNLAETTVRSVARGILGVALIQSLLAGIGFLAVGIPGAGLWALIALFLSIIQIGVLPVTVPVVIYVFATGNMTVAIIFLIWNIFVSTIDNVLKPILLGRGVKVPMVVIFAGAIGGFISSGIIGLFTGAVILTLGYTLFQAWLNEAAESENEQDKSAS